MLTILLSVTLVLPAIALEDDDAAYDTTPTDPTPNTNAPIAVVMDFYTGEILFEKNMEQPWIPASMSKSMTAFIVYQEIAAGNLTLETEILVSAEAARFSSRRGVPGSYVPLPSGEYITVDTLLQLLMIPSGNAAAVVFAEHISGSEAAFVERMNETAAAMGLYAEYTNSHGAYVNYTNAYSTAMLTREFITLYPDILRITSMRSVRFRGRNYRNTNHLVSRNMFPEADGFKTGSLRQAGWNHSTTAVRDGRRIIAVVMNTRSSSARQIESRLLLNFGFEELERRETERVERARVFYDGNLITLTTPPRMYYGVLLLPIYDVLEYLGYTIEWFEELSLVSITHDNGDTATLFTDRDLVVINGDTSTVRLPAQVVDGLIYISPETIGMLTGTFAEWSIETNIVRFR